jgi:hypothetical protein
MSSSYKMLIAQHVNNLDETNTAVRDERLQYQGLVTAELNTKLSALENHDAAERAAKSRLVLAMQQDFECGAFSSTSGDTTGEDSSMLSTFVAITTESAKLPQEKTRQCLALLLQ